MRHTAWQEKQLEIEALKAGSRARVISLPKILCSTLFILLPSTMYPHYIDVGTCFFEHGVREEVNAPKSLLQKQSLSAQIDAWRV